MASNLGFTVPKAPSVPSFSYKSYSGGLKPTGTTPFKGTGLKGLSASRSTPKFPTHTSIPKPHAPAVASGVSLSKTALAGYKFKPTGVSSSPWSQGSASSGPTAEQQIAAMLAKQQQGGGGSIWDQIQHGAGSLLGDALNIISRPAWAVAQGTNAALDNKSIVHGLEQGITGHPMTFGQILAQHHILDNHTILRGIAGLGLDVATDPTNALLLAATPLTGGASDALLAEKLAAEGGAGAARAIADASAATREAGIGSALSAPTRALAPAQEAKWNEILGSSLPSGKNLNQINAAEEAQLSAANTGRAVVQRAAGAAREDQAKVIQARLGLTKAKSIPITPTTILGHRVAPLAPSLLRTADKLGVVGKIPLVAPLAEHVGIAFKPDWRDPIAHSFDAARVHSAETLRNSHMSHVFKTLKSTTKAKVKNEDLLNALHWYEGTKGAVRDHVLNEEALKASGLSGAQQEFVRGFHEIMSRQREFDKAYGVKYQGESLGVGPEGRGYVPHHYTREGNQFTRGAIRAGYTKARQGDMTLKDILGLHAEGHLNYEPETDVMRLIQHRVMAGGQQQARSMMERVMTEMYGTPLRVSADELIKHRKELARGAHLAVASHAGFMRTHLPRIQNEARAAHVAANRETLAESAAREDAKIAQREEALAAHIRRKGGLVTAAKRQAEKYQRDVAPHEAATKEIKANEKLVRAQTRRVTFLEGKLHALDTNIAETAGAERSAGVAKGAERSAVSAQTKQLKAHLAEQKAQLKQVEKDLADARAKHEALSAEANSAASSSAAHIRQSFSDLRDEFIREHRLQRDQVQGLMKRIQAKAGDRFHPTRLKPEHRLLLHNADIKDKELQAIQAELVGAKGVKQLTDILSRSPLHEGKTPSELKKMVQDRLAGVRDRVLPPAAAKTDAVNKLGEHINELIDRHASQSAIVDEAAKELADHQAAMHLPKTMGRPRLTESEKLLRQRSKLVDNLESERAILNEHTDNLAAAHAARDLIEKPKHPTPGIRYFNRTQQSLEKAVKQARVDKQKRLLRQGFRLDRNTDNLEARLARDRARSQLTLRRLQSKAVERDRIAAKPATMPNPLLHDALERVPTVSKTHAFPKDIAEGLRRVEAANNNPEEVQKVVRMLDKTMSKWKLGVTAVNPGYRIRNSMTDMWNAYISGMPLRAMPKYANRAGHLLHAAANGDIHAQHLLAQAQVHGVLSGLFKGDVAKGLAEVEGKGGPLKRYVRFATNKNTQAENFGRLTHYLWRLDTGHDAIDAAREVRRAHFDYEDLTNIEQKLFKRVAPFYTWTRKNVPFQIQQMISRPGRYSTFSKIGQESEFASGNHKGELLPDFLKQGLAFKLPIGKDTYYIPQFGPVDLARIGLAGGTTTQKLQNLGQFLGPQYQIPLGALFGVNAFSGQPIQGPHKFNPSSGLLAGLLKPFGLGGTTQRNIAGKEVRGPGATPWADFLLGQLPAAQFLNKSIDNKIASKENPAAFRAASYLGGFPIFNNNQAEQKQIAISNFEQQTLPQYIRDLRDAGLFPNAQQHKKSANQRAIEQILLQSLGRR